MQPQSLQLSISGWRHTARQYVELTKPRVTMLAAFCALIGMFMASDRMVPWQILLFGTAGIALLAAISAPTTLAIALAESANLCLVGFARDGHCTVYAHAERLAHALHRQSG